MPVIAAKQPIPAKAAEEPPKGRLYFRISVGPTPELLRLLEAGYKIVKIEGPRPN